MAAPYLMAMEHSEWHARNVFKKQRKRPLGKLHGYSPPQPVLSCRTVDIDNSGTRTYRSKSNRDIIDEQHKLIHGIYARARNISSAPASGNRRLAQSTGYSTVQNRPLSSVQIQGAHAPGNGYDNVSTDESFRPNSSTSNGSSRRPMSGRSTATKTDFIVLKARPHTAGSKKYTSHIAGSTRIELGPDPEWEEINEAYKSARNNIKRSWEVEYRTLDGGKFARGKKDGAEVPSKSCQGWMTFGGGQKERSAGIVDAFTSVKQEDKYFKIDGFTGVTVAKQLHRGDKIIIGRNGQASSLETKYLQEGQQQTDEVLNTIDEVAITDTQPKIMPLNWEEQMLAGGGKVITASIPHKPKPKVYESLVFKKFGEDGSRPPPPTVPQNGITSETKIRSNKPVPKTPIKHSENTTTKLSDKNEKVVARPPSKVTPGKTTTAGTKTPSVDQTETNTSSNIKVVDLASPVKEHVAERVAFDDETKPSRQNKHVKIIPIALDEDDEEPAVFDNIPSEKILEVKIKSRNSNGIHVHEGI